jgi:hypothetical protein
MLVVQITKNGSIVWLNNVAIVGGVVATFLIVAPLYGVLPLESLPKLGISFWALGYIECISRGSEWLACPLAGLPSSQRLGFGLPMAILAATYHRILGGDVLVGFNLAGLSLLALGVSSMWWLLRMVGAHTWCAVAGALLFYSLPIVHGKADYAFLMWGFALLPFGIATTVLHWKSDRLLFSTLLVAASSTLLMFQEPYSFVMMVSFGAAYGFVHTLFAWKKNLATALLKTGAWAASIAIAIMCYRYYLPESADYGVMPEDFFRGAGIDLIGFVARSREFLFQIDYGFNDVDPMMYFSDGEAVRHSYIGIGLLMGIGSFIFLVKFWRSAPFTGILFVAACSLLISLGPSLKINSYREVPPHAPIVFKDYLMPKDTAVADLPHAFIYKYPPAKYMRSVSRWFLLFALCAVVMTSIFVSRMVERKVSVVFLAVFAVWLIVEYAPNYSLKARQIDAATRGYKQFKEDVAGRLTDFLTKGDKVLFVGENGVRNEYLSTYLCAIGGCRTYNASSDKALEIARSSWPALLKTAVDQKLSHPERAQKVALVLQERLVDVVILPHFDMRWDSYQWPPNGAVIAERAARLKKAYSGIVGVERSESTYFTVLRAVRAKPMGIQTDP